MGRNIIGVIKQTDKFRWVSGMHSGQCVGAHATPGPWIQITIFDPGVVHARLGQSKGAGGYPTF